MEQDWEKLEVLLETISNDELVVFAGAGVSMGKPSNLPDFEKLVYKISKNTPKRYNEDVIEALQKLQKPDRKTLSEIIKQCKPPDHFLGILHYHGINVHKITTRILSELEEKNSPNSLHKNLLRLFPKNKPKIITTNFDHFFEKAAEENNFTPSVYQAPVLPTNTNFSGIVHLHGKLPDKNDPKYYEKCKHLILTDEDFGRAYLTEGWARRFFVDVFHHFTVLFIGYSYNDIIVSYLTRSLPADRTKNHFILTEDKQNNWDSFGLIPIYFDKTENTDNPYQELYELVDNLANIVTRDKLQWKKEIKKIVDRGPFPVSVPEENEKRKLIKKLNEDIAEIRYALKSPYNTKLFLDCIKNPWYLPNLYHWIKWLNEYHYFDALFEEGDLNERDQLLAKWLVDISIKYQNDLINYCAEKRNKRNQDKINIFLWKLIFKRIITLEIDNNNDNKGILFFRQWIITLLTTIPNNIFRFIKEDDFVKLCQKCNNHEQLLLLLEIFFTISTHNLHLHEDPTTRKQINNFYSSTLTSIFNQTIKPHQTPFLYHQLLSGILLQLEKVHAKTDRLLENDQSIIPSPFHNERIEPLYKIAETTLEWWDKKESEDFKNLFKSKFNNPYDEEKKKLKEVINSILENCYPDTTHILNDLEKFKDLLKKHNIKLEGECNCFWDYVNAVQSNCEKRPSLASKLVEMFEKENLYSESQSYSCPYWKSILLSIFEGFKKANFSYYNAFSLLKSLNKSKIFLQHAKKYKYEITDLLCVLVNSKIFFNEKLFKEADDIASRLLDKSSSDGKLQNIIRLFLTTNTRNEYDKEISDNIIHSYVSLMMFYIPCFEIKKLLLELFESHFFELLENRISFAKHISICLKETKRGMNKKTWLYFYWRNRCDGIYVPLDKQEEIEIILRWLPYLGKTFPQASSLAIESLTENQITDICLSPLLKNLYKTTLVSGYPNETAKLIICLCQCASYSQLNLKPLNNIVKKLQNIENRLKNELNEVLLKCGSKYQLPCK